MVFIREELRINTIFKSRKELTTIIRQEINNFFGCSQSSNIFNMTIPEINEILKGWPEKKIETVASLNEKCRECPALSHCKTNCWCKTLQK